MQDIRTRIEIKSIRWKIENRILQKFGHVHRMSNSRTYKAAIVGRKQDLERHKKLGRLIVFGENYSKNLACSSHKMNPTLQIDEDGRR